MSDLRHQNQNLSSFEISKICDQYKFGNKTTIKLNIKQY